MKQKRLNAWVQWEAFWKLHHRPKRLRFTFRFGTFKTTGDFMTFSMPANAFVSVQVSPILADGNPSTATLSNVTFSSDDETVFTVAPDPAVPSGAIVTGVTAGRANLTSNATATEPDGTTRQISGVATIELTPVAVPPDQAAALAFTFGTPVVGPPAPPAAATK